jgi:uncharacterized protein YgiB involved in biofilm formation
MTQQPEAPKNSHGRKVHRQGSWQRTSTKVTKDPKKLQVHAIRRKRVYLGLAIATGLAFLVSRCSDSEREQIANESVNAVFYQNTAQCEADANKQQIEYEQLQKKYQSGQLAEPPNSPAIQVPDCAPQMLAAQQEHDKTAPIYGSIEDCQSEGVQCEATLGNAPTSGYRPVYGGTYLDPYESPSYTYITYGGRQYVVYEPRPVYRSIIANRVVTPHGREIIQVSTGRVSAPRHSTFAAPARPTGITGKGTIRGRGTSGFGSSFKSSGSGGK